MKKFASMLPFACIVCFAFYITGCKKCYHCYNECTQCLFTEVIAIDSTRDSIHIDTNLYCTDYVATRAEYENLVNNDTAAGYTCTPAKPTYEYDFCVNKPGDDRYPNYFDKGGRAKCDRK